MREGMSLICIRTLAGREVVLQRDHQQRVGHKVHVRRAVHPGAGLHDAQAVGHQHGVQARGHLPRAREPEEPGEIPQPSEPVNTRLTL